MAGNPMRYINGYLIEDDDGLTLIDAGWKADDVLAALHAGLREHGWALADIRRLLITHCHFDHYGLAATLHGELATILRRASAEAPVRRRRVFGGKRPVLPV